MSNFQRILMEFSPNERLIFFTIINEDKKLSYEDLAYLLGKEVATIRTQLASIMKKRKGIIEEVTDGIRKRFFISKDTKDRLHKHTRVKYKE